jgi:hypothetical protein
VGLLKTFSSERVAAIPENHTGATKIRTAVAAVFSAHAASTANAIPTQILTQTGLVSAHIRGCSLTA